MTAEQYLAHATSLVCAATGADPAVVRERLAQSVQILMCEGLEGAPVAEPAACDYDRRCGRCADCDVADEEDDAPTAAELRWADLEEYQREARRSLRW